MVVVVGEGVVGGEEVVVVVNVVVLEFGVEAEDVVVAVVALLSWPSRLVQCLRADACCRMLTHGVVVLLFLFLLLLLFLQIGWVVDTWSTADDIKFALRKIAVVVAAGEI